MNSHSGNKKKMRVLAFPAFKNKGSNPYNFLLYKNLKCFDIEVFEFSFARALALKHDLIHIHWPERYLNSNSWLKAIIGSTMLLWVLLWNKINSKKIIWTVHNLEPHDVKYPLLNKIFWRAFLALVSGSISLSNANLELCFNKYPKLRSLPNAVTYHGLYKDIYPNNVTKNAVCQKFSISKDERVCLFLGRVMRYKNIDALIKLFLSKELANVKLIIAGRIDDDSYHRELIELMGNSKNIIMKDGFVKDDELQDYMQAADVMVLPFDKIFNSGSALLGVSFGVTVLVPYSKNFEEYQEITSGYLRCYQGALMASHIIDALPHNRDGNRQEPMQLEWKKIARTTLDFYEAVTNKS